MRCLLGKMDGTRSRFHATFERFGKKSGYKVPWLLTLLLVDVKRVDDGSVVTDHAWMNYGKQFGSLDLHAGDVVEFDARVGMYQKGYSEDDEDNPFRFDYRLERPTRMEKVGRAEGDFTIDEKMSRETFDLVTSWKRGDRPTAPAVIPLPPSRQPLPGPARVPGSRAKTLLDFA